MTDAVLSDAELIQRFARSRDPAAMRLLVERYQGLVCASALRQLRQPELAEDVTQAVFMVLSTKAATLTSYQTLGGWLLRVTRYAAIDAMRKAKRQIRHERAAAEERPEVAAMSSASDEWDRLSTQLDEAMATLSEMDRSLIVQRFFQDQSFAEVGRVYGVSEEAARKRVSRALERLRQLLLKNGLSMPVMSIGPLLTQHASPAAPQTLSAVLAGNASAASFSIVKGTLAMIAWTKAKLVGLFVIGGVLALGGGAVVLQKWNIALAEPIVPPAPPVIANDAATMYRLAAEKIVTDSPAASALDYRLPFGPEWMQLAKAADERNKPARDLVRQARTFNTADWPSGDPKYLNPLRALANEVGDAALYAHSQQRDADAVELIRDGMHLSSLLMGKQKADGLIRMLVGIGIDALLMQRVCTISSRIAISNDGAGQTVSVADIRALIATLLGHPTPDERVNDAMAGEPGMQNLSPVEIAASAAILGASLDRTKIAVKRVNADRTYAAMSLACQLYRFEKNAWPTKLDDLIPAYLPVAPVDPFGDGKQTYGYVLIKAGRPDGGDRPLVYSRSESKDGLFFRVDMPMFGFYTGDGSNAATRDQKYGGQFRDVTWWEPRLLPANAPTTQPLPQ